MTRSYRRLHLLVEGTTEETIVREVVAPHLESIGWDITVTTPKTRRTGSEPARRGGVGAWKPLRKEITNLLGDSSLSLLTTMFDYYGFPSDAPGMVNRPDLSAIERVAHVEQSLEREIGDRRFVPHLVLHEVEAWVFAAADQLADQIDDERLARRLLRDVEANAGPEGINEGPETAPSKRLLRYCPTYIKQLDGPEAVRRLGLVALRQQCPHMDAWLRKFERVITDDVTGGEVHSPPGTTAGDTRR